MQDDLISLSTIKILKERVRLPTKRKDSYKKFFEVEARENMLCQNLVR